MVIEQAKEVLKIEAQGIIDLIERIGPEFEKAIQMILEAKGRVILTGMGKSGLVGRKISATLNSTGTPSLFLHPAEAAHGDLGVVGSGDVVLAISKSGASDEIGDLLPAFKRLEIPIILITGRLDGELAKRADIVLDAGVAGEAEPNDLVPTCSTTAALAIGDALIRRVGQLEALDRV